MNTSDLCQRFEDLCRNEVARATGEIPALRFRRGLVFNVDVESYFVTYMPEKVAKVTLDEIEEFVAPIASRLGYSALSQKAERYFANTATPESDIESKIKKLLSLAESSNEHEAALALGKARELASKHGVTTGGESYNGYAHATLGRMPACVTWPVRCSAAINALITEFGCTTLACGSTSVDKKTRKIIRVYGQQKDVELSIYAWDFLMVVFARFFKTLKGSGFKKYDCLYGFLLGVQLRLNETRVKTVSKSCEIVVQKSKQADAFVEYLHGQLKSVSGRSQADLAAAGAGFEVGKQTTINKPVGASQQQKRIRG